MDEIKSLNQAAYDWIMKENPKYWARCIFSQHSKCNKVANNMNENRKQFGLKQYGTLTPKAKSKLEKNKKKARRFEVIYAGRRIFEVAAALSIFIVDLGKQKCSCKKWDLIDIPCPHAVASIFF
ncbi:uncharacterized protein [Typha angustifolia]|uniref:uncharacterized protein n=1 Tax=Typha angustifolia TaxID=59011 RepID=UPI003C2FF50E